jgi:hypothetical protein
MDLNLFNQAPPEYVYVHWKTGTVLTCIIMAISMAYVVLEWCLQSHLSTESPNDARKGLQRTRRFRWFISPLQSTINIVYFTINRAFAVLLLLKEGKSGKGMQKSLVWTKDITYEYSSHSQQSQYTSSPSLSSTGLMPAAPAAGNELSSYSLFNASLPQPARYSRLDNDTEMDADGPSARVPLIIGQPHSAYAPLQRNRTPSSSSVNSDEVAEVGPLDAMPVSIISPPPMERPRRLTGYPPRQWNDFGG